MKFEIQGNKKHLEKLNGDFCIQLENYKNQFLKIRVLTKEKYPIGNLYFENNPNRLVVKIKDEEDLFDTDTCDVVILPENKEEEFLMAGLSYETSDKWHLNFLVIPIITNGEIDEKLIKCRLKKSNFEE